MSDEISHSQSYIKTCLDYPTEACVDVRSVDDAVLATFPVVWLEKGQVHSWAFIHHSLSLVVVGPGALVASETRDPVDPSLPPVAGAYVFIRESAPLPPFSPSFLGPFLTRSMSASDGRPVQYAVGPEGSSRFKPARPSNDTSTSSRSSSTAGSLSTKESQVRIAQPHVVTPTPR